jgi:Domain of unknown function (DUF5666)
MEIDMKTFIQHNVKYFQALMLAIALGACGGGGTQVADVGTSGTGIVASGTITSFGSVFVNGVKFSTSSATKISDDDVSIDEDKLKVGQVVEIKGKSQDSTNGTADSIMVNKELKGPVDKLFDASVIPNSLGVMGQKVIIDNNTIVDNNLTGGLAVLTVGTLVEVHGFRDATGAIRATRIERQNNVTGQFKVSGVISAISSVTAFKIGDLTINYPGVTVKNLPAGGLAIGQRVEVKASAAPSNNTLTATSVEVKTGVSASNGDKGEVEGTIANFDGDCKFNINAQAVDACNVSEYERGAKADLANGKRIEAEGTLTNGVLIARKIEFKSSGDSSGGGGFSSFVRVNARVQTLTSTPTDRSITVLNKTFKLDASTQFEDKLGIARTFNIENFREILKPGDIVEIRGFEDNSGLNATLVERNDDSEVIIQGRLEQNIATQLTIQGVVVRVGLNTQFRDANDNPITRAQFDTAVAIGAKVKAKGSNAGASDNTLDATSGEVEIET